MFTVGLITPEPDFYVIAGVSFAFFFDLGVKCFPVITTVAASIPPTFFILLIFAVHINNTVAQFIICLAYLDNKISIGWTVH